ncbi:MAG: HD domain-containing protein [Chitinivibrionales bacterium]|nr:HD domain-containing protein [Chitinivibrionales bacterium]
MVYHHFNKEIVIVDSEVEPESNLTVALRDSGYKPLLFSNLDEALERLNHQSASISLCIIDYALLEQRQDVLWSTKTSLRHLPSIFVSGPHESLGALSALLQAGAHDFLLKPYDCGLVLRKIEQARDYMMLAYHRLTLGRYTDHLLKAIDINAILRIFFTVMRQRYSFDIIGYLNVQKRGSEFIYWSRAQLTKKVVDSIINSLSSKNSAGSCAPDIKKQPTRITKLLSSSRTTSISCLRYNRSMVLQWDDFNCGTLFFGAEQDISSSIQMLHPHNDIIQQTRIALINAWLYSNMKENYIRTIKALAIAVDAKDPYTHGHSENVSNIAQAIAVAMKLDERAIGVIRDSALLHDIGKIGIPGYLLNKPGPLTHEEYNGVMKTHSMLGATIIQEVPFLHDLSVLILHHHENFDGTGYPHGLQGEQIPLGAQIIHVADAFEAMTSQRPYRESLDKVQALAVLAENRGKLFSPRVVDTFITIADQNF